MIELSVDWLGLFLIAIMFLSGLWNAAIGPGGGVTFATLALTLSPGVAIPVHAVVGGASGAIRGWILRDLVDRRFLKHFILGGLPGFAFGLVVLARAPVPGPILQTVVGVFIVVSAWMPLARTYGVSRRSQIVMGAMTAILGLFVGGMQVIVATSLRSKGVEQRRVVATSTAAVLFQFSVKLVLFGLTGFSFARHGGLLVVLATASLAGTWLGSRVSFDLPQQVVSQLFRVVVTIIGSLIIGRSLTQALGPARVVAIAEAAALPGVLVVLAATITVWISRPSAVPAYTFIGSIPAQSYSADRTASGPHGGSRCGRGSADMIDPIERYLPAAMAVARHAAITDEIAAQISLRSLHRMRQVRRHQPHRPREGEAFLLTRRAALEVGRSARLDGGPSGMEALGLEATWDIWREALGASRTEAEC